MKLELVSPQVFLDHLQAATEKDLVVASNFACRRQHWSCPDRQLDHHVLWYFDYGEYVGEAGGVAFRVKPRMFQWISSQVTHRFFSAGEKGYSNFSLRFSLKKGPTLLRLKPDLIAIEGRTDLRDLMDQVYLAQKFTAPFCFEKVRALLTLLVVEVLNAGGMRGPVGESNFGPGELKRLDQFMEDRIRDPMKPSHLAKHFRLNPDYFARKFKRQFGCSPRRWLRDEKIRRACSLLCDRADSIKEIAESLGFRDQRFFSRQFKKSTGMTPKQYRRQH